MERKEILFVNVRICSLIKMKPSPCSSFLFRLSREGLILVRLAYRVSGVLFSVSQNLQKGCLIFFQLGQSFLQIKKFLIAITDIISAYCKHVFCGGCICDVKLPERAKISSRKLPDVRYLPLNMFNFKIVLLIYALGMLYVRPILLTVCNRLIEITTTSVVCDVYIQF